MHPVLFHIGAVLIPSYGAVTALGVLLALVLAQRTARIAAARRRQGLESLHCEPVCGAGRARGCCWSSSTGAPCACIPPGCWGSPWFIIRCWPPQARWPAPGALLWYARRNQLPLRATADALAAPLALGLAFEQLGALLAGSGYGIEAGDGVRWAVTYTNPLAALWSGAPLGVPLHPVQAYAALAFLTLALFLLVWLPAERRNGRRGRPGSDGRRRRHLHHRALARPGGPRRDADRGAAGALDGPQMAAVLLVIAGALVLLERKAARQQAEDDEPAA